MVVFDDHEVENNYAGLYDENGNPPESFVPRRAAAFQAYYEHMPLRAAQLPNGPDMQLFRRIQFGDLALLNMLDTRQYRNDQVCTGGGTTIGCTEALDPNRTLLGAAQERWLKTNLAASPTTWNVLGQQVFFAQRDFEAGPLKRLSLTRGMVMRRRAILLNTVVGANVKNLVVLTGDVHVNYACELKANFDDPSSATIGSEFVGTSITSGGNGADLPTNAATLFAENPPIKFVNQQRGSSSST